MYTSNLPEVKLGIVAVSRDCFPKELSYTRCKAVVDEYGKYGNIFRVEDVVENERDVVHAIDTLRAAGVNALVVYLGNFGPEAPETLLAERFDGPVMFAAAAEERSAVLKSDRGDAFCGLLNACYNLGLRGLTPYLPAYPVGDAGEVAEMIAEFVPIARTYLGVRHLKIITFGPRPQDFFACNAPIAPLYRLGVNIEENSELDLLLAFDKHANDPRIGAVVKDMACELGTGNHMPDLLPQLAQFELTLLDWMEEHKGAAQYVAFANKCWPAFQRSFKFVPCYVNSRMARRGIPIACEVDIYGALSEYFANCVSGTPVTLLDINNTVPKEMFCSADKAQKKGYSQREVFMGFHCGNTPICYLKQADMKYQLIMHRENEASGKPNLSRGTLEGALVDGDITLFRLQASADGHLSSYIAQGEVLPIAPCSFGGIGVIGIKGLDRFYRNVLLAKRYPHHAVVAFGHYGKTIFEALRMLQVNEIDHNVMDRMLYENENPFSI